MERIADNFKDLVELCVERNPDGTAFEWSVKDTVLKKTYKEFKEDIDALGAYMYSHKLKGEKIALIGENSYNWIMSYFSVTMGSSVIVPIDKELSVPEILNLLKSSKAAAIIYSDMYTKTIDALSQKVKLKHYINMKDFPEILACGRELIEKGAAEYAKNEIDNDALSSLIYTSGTTGTPKGVMLSQHNIMASAVSAAHNVTITDTSLLVLPLHHTFAFTAGVIAVLWYGYPIAISKNLRTFLSDLQVFKPQNMFLVPQLLEGIYKKIWATAKSKKLDTVLKVMIGASSITRFARLDLRRKLFKTVLGSLGGKLDLIICGGAALDERYIKYFDDFGINVLNGYGITECAPVVAVNCNDRKKPYSVGLVMDCNVVKIANPDENGNGEVYVQGSNVMLGYYNDPKDKYGAFEDGWFKTGDLGHLDEDNYLYITGRKKNLIILSNGKNIYPEEIEESLARIPNVMEVLVYAENEAITAEIYAEDTTGIEAAVKQMNKELPLHKHVKKVKFRDSEFEKTTTHKIKRTQTVGC